jgi:hypothetical protein
MANLLNWNKVKPEDKFECCDCHNEYSGEEVQNRDIDLILVDNNRYRCHLCQEDIDDYNNE